VPATSLLACSAQSKGPDRGRLTGREGVRPIEQAFGAAAEPAGLPEREISGHSSHRSGPARFASGTLLGCSLAVVNPMRSGAADSATGRAGSGSGQRLLADCASSESKGGWSSSLKRRQAWAQVGCRTQGRNARPEGERRHQTNTFWIRGPIRRNPANGERRRAGRDSAMPWPRRCRSESQVVGFSAWLSSAIWETSRACSSTTAT